MTTASIDLAHYYPWWLDNVIRVIVANPVMIKAYQGGVPGNGKAFPDGSKIVKVVVVRTLLAPAATPERRGDLKWST